MPHKRCHYPPHPSPRTPFSIFSHPITASLLPQAPLTPKPRSNPSPTHTKVQNTIKVAISIVRSFTDCSESARPRCGHLQMTTTRAVTSYCTSRVNFDPKQGPITCLKSPQQRQSTPTAQRFNVRTFAAMLTYHNDGHAETVTRTTSPTPRLVIYPKTEKCPQNTHCLVPRRCALYTFKPPNSSCFNVAHQALSTGWKQ